MFPLTPALLLAVWLIQPWNVVASSGPPAAPPPAAQARQFSGDYADRMLFRLERASAIVADPSLAPTPPPTPPPLTPPPPTVAPTAAPTSIPISALTSQEIYSVVCSYAWPCEQALRVMWCESGGKSWVVGRGVNYGLFQINQIHARRIANFWSSWMDPASNIEWAYQLWVRQGWKPWACQP